MGGKDGPSRTLGTYRVILSRTYRVVLPDAKRMWETARGGKGHRAPEMRQVHLCWISGPRHARWQCVSLAGGG